MPVLESVPEGDTAPARAQPGPTDPGGSNGNEQTAKASQIGPDLLTAGSNTADTNAASGDKKKGHYFGLPKNSTNTAYVSPDDYEQKYPEDPINDALGPNARVWRVYLDEAKAFDDNMIDGWKDTIDVLLVFAGLFSAVVTTFVVQTSQSLQPDYSEISALLLTELVGLQRALADGCPPASVPAASKNATSSFAAARSDQWVNGLWFTSLALSLATALMSVLVKQWLQHYVAPVSGIV